MRLHTSRQTFTVQVGDAEVDVCPMASSEVSALARKHTKIDFRKGRQTEQFDAGAFALALWQETVVGWRGMEGDDGPLPCTAETKAQVWNHNPGFAAEVLDRSDEAASAWQEDRGKNS